MKKLSDCKTGDSHTGLTRRKFISLMGALAVSPKLYAQATAASIPLRKLHNFGLRVSDVSRSLAFYQGLFGSPVQARQGDTVVLRLGEGPGFYSLSPIQAGQQPGITHIGLSVAGFDLPRLGTQLQAQGIDNVAGPAPADSRLQLASKYWINTRGPEQGGSPTGTQELYFADQDGIVYQLNDPEYCGGSGAFGTECRAITNAPSDGLIQLRELSHFTNYVHNRDAANRYHRQLFGLDFQAYQGSASPVIGIGDGFQFLMYVGGNGTGQPTQPGRIDHVCMGMDGFDVDGVRRLLDGYGLQPRQDPSETPPLVHYVSMRMPNRGGAEGGTPELYFSDPDGIRIQLQDPTYCGGGGYLGDDCSN